jgi:hypothetical protein
VRKLILGAAALALLLSSASLAREGTDVLLPAAFAGEWCRTNNELDSPYGPEWKRKQQGRPCRYADTLTITRTRFSGVMEGQATNCIVTGKGKDDWWTFTCDGKPNLRNVFRLSKGRLYTLGQMVAEYDGSAALAVASGANAATDEYEGCLAYNKPVTLTGTVLIRKINYEKLEDAPPEGSVPFPLLVADQPICVHPSDDIDVAEGMEWALQIADSCARAWPAVSRVRITGMLYHAITWHHHSKVLILAKQIVRLDGQLPPCGHE